MSSKTYGRLLMTAALALYALFFALQALLHEPADHARHEAQRKEAQAQLAEQEKRVQSRFERQPELMRFSAFGLLALMYWGTFFNVYFGRRWMRGEPWPVERSGLGSTPRWGPDDAWAAIAMLFLIELALFAGQVLVGLAAGWKNDHPDSWFLVSGLVRNVLVTLFIAFLLRKRFGHAFTDLGLKDPKWKAQMGYGLLAYVAMIPPLVISLIAVAVVMKLFQAEPEPQEVVQVFLRQGAEPFLIGLTFFVALAGPVMEEIFFRGFLYAGFRSRFGAPAGALMSAVVFAALHLHAPAFFPILLLGLFLAYLYEVSGSLVAPVTVHIVHNAVMVSLTMGFKYLSGPSA